MVSPDNANTSVNDARMLGRKPGVPALAVVLGIVSVVAALAICFASYKHTLFLAEQSFQQFYLDIARMFASESDVHTECGDKQLLSIIDRHWRKLSSMPGDAYICVIDGDSKLVFHSAYPETVGNCAGKNIIKGNATHPKGTLSQLVESQIEYVGEYVSSAGVDQVAAFVPIPKRGWMLGVHRCRKNLINEVRAGIEPLYIGMVAVCGGLIPISIFLLSATFHATQRKHYLAEQAIREGEVKYHTLLENLPQKIFYKDIDSVYMSCNKNFANEFGLTPGKIVGITDYDIFPKELADKYRDDDRRIIDIQYTEDIEEKYVKDEQNYIVQTVKTPVKNKDGKVVGVLGIFWDITERKQAEKALHMTQFSVDRAEFEVFWVDENARFIYVNDYACNKLGYTKEEFAGMAVMDVNPGFTMDKWPQFWEKSEQEKTLRLQSLHQRKDGSTFPVAVIVNHLEYGDKGYNFVYAVDVTERQKAQQERETLLSELDAKNQELQSIVYAASHDLRTPLVNIAGFSGVLDEHCQDLVKIIEGQDVSEEAKDKLRELLAEEIPEDIAFIKNGTNQMSILIDGLLKVSRVGTTEVNPGTIDMNQIVSELVSMVKFQAEKKHAEITFGEMPGCVCDPRQIRQLFGNLINNALKYLDVERPGKVHISAVQNNGQVTYCVSDNGIGIDPNYQQKIFEIYHRLNPEDAEGGEGLGLTIVRRILDRYNGRISLESEMGVGSKFYVTLQGIEPQN